MDKLKNFKSISFKINLRALRMGESPEKDWGIIFIATTALCILALVFNTKLFYGTTRALDVEGEGMTDPRSRTLNVLRLNEVITHYEAKAAAFERIKQSRSNIPDPSI
jgi:hypothetical protein